MLSKNAFDSLAQLRGPFESHQNQGCFWLSLVQG